MSWFESFILGLVQGLTEFLPISSSAHLRLTAADRQLSRHGFRSMLVIRLLPGVPFAASNYGAAVSRMGWPAFLAATAVGVIPNTAAYVIAGSHAAAPTSPVFLAAFGFIALSGLGGAVFAWRKRALLHGATPQR